ncbi:response regulator [Pseudomonas sp. N040]|uniref:response regulator n=1 Tax=Pseudomonas sp. N040 TaxID=2785325 RepID=UPI0018A32C84|nr:response regulator [Pseudomonas sp. N040]MBF7729824.1 response regulator [Pseudomonas sp. N040]MBW7013466.1 response regulator [Pseudomonas sp. N040]
MFKELSIRSRLLLLSLLPAGLLASLLGWLVLAPIPLPDGYPALLALGPALLVPGLGSLLALRWAHAIELQLQQALARQQGNGTPPEPASEQQSRDSLDIQHFELQLLRQQAREANRSKAEFLSNMSHELRTPLNGILGFADLLGKTALDAGQRDYLQTIQQSAGNLLGLLGKVLDFASLENGQVQLDSSVFNLRDLVQDSLALLAPAAHEKHLELVSLVYRDTPTMLIGDPLRLQQILGQLINNAIKFTAHGSVVVRAMLEDEHEDVVELRISVQDSGIGLEPAAAQRLFDAFNQADNSLTRQAGGAGLGLTICQHLIGLMGGSIGIDSVPGEGAEFWISLRLAKASQPDALPPAVLRGRRVAVFEAHPLAQQSLQHQLADCGVEVCGFASMEELLQALGSQAPELAVIGTSQRTLPAEQLAGYLQQLRQHGCPALVLCPTTEQPLFADALQDAGGLLQFKPAATRKLLQALGELLAPGLVSSRQARAPVTDEPPRILCVDDNPVNLLLVETLLGNLGARVMAVDSGYAALQAVAEDHFELILMDIQMPGMDGLQATRAIRQREQELQLPAVPVIALTAHALPGQQRALREAGLDDYRSKPISEQQLARLIQQWTGKNLLAALTEPAAPAGPASPAEMPAILDEAEGLRLAAGNAELAKDLLAMFLATLHDEQAALRQARASQAHQRLAERVHRLLGATRYCGVPQLRAACQQCENLLRQDAAYNGEALDQLDSAICCLLQAAAAQPTAGSSSICH